MEWNNYRGYKILLEASSDVLLLFSDKTYRKEFNVKNVAKTPKRWESLVKNSSEWE